MKKYGEISGKRFIFEVDVECRKELHKLRNDLLFLPKRMKIKNLCVISMMNLFLCCRIRTLKQAQNHGLILTKVNKIIKCINQKTWLKPYIEINTNLRTDAKNDIEKDFSL